MLILRSPPETFQSEKQMQISSRQLLPRRMRLRICLFVLQIRHQLHVFQGSSLTCNLHPGRPHALIFLRPGPRDDLLLWWLSFFSSVSSRADPVPFLRRVSAQPCPEPCHVTSVSADNYTCAVCLKVVAPCVPLDYVKEIKALCTALTQIGRGISSEKIECC